MWLLYYFIYIDKSDDGLDEPAVFRENYALLCNTITDIVDPLIKCFEEESVFEQKQLTNIISASDKIRILLLNISSSLNASSTKGFYMMLKIMKEQGGKVTQTLACHIMSRLKVSADKSCHSCSDGANVQDDELKS